MQPPAFSSLRFCAIKVYSVVTNEEQNLGGILVMFWVFFPGHSGLAFDVNGYSAIELSASANWFQWSVKFRYIYETGYSSHREVFLFWTMPMPFMRISSFRHPACLFLPLLALHVNSQQQEKAWELWSRLYLFQMFLNMPVKKAL